MVGRGGRGRPPARRRRRNLRECRHGFRRVLDMAFGMGAPRSLEQMRDQLGRAEALGFTDVVIAWPRDEDPLRGSESVLAELGALLVDGSLAP